MPGGVDDEGVGFPGRDRLIAGVAEHRREAGHVGAPAQRVRTSSDDGRDEPHGQRDHEQGDDQLEEGEARGVYFAALSHDVTSAFSPSPPGALSPP